MFHNSERISDFPPLLLKYDIIYNKRVKIWIIFNWPKEIQNRRMLEYNQPWRNVAMRRVREFLKINYDCHLGISRQIFHRHFLQSKENSKLKLTVHSPCLLTKVSLIQFPMSGKHSAILCQESSKSGCLSSILPPAVPHILPAFARPPRPSVPTCLLFPISPP